MQGLLNTAVDAARQAGNVLTRILNRGEHLDVRTKGTNEFVSQADHAAEEAIIDTILRRYPDHAILAEESGSQGESEFQWIIDPLDGTTNYVHGFPVFAVSIAVTQRGRAEVAVVHDPVSQELFTAVRGRGAQLDGKRIRVSGRQDLHESLIGTGFPYHANRRWLNPYMGMLRTVMKSSAGVRRPGAAALDLANLAAGRLDGFWEFGLKPWDIAAGTLLIREAGGLVEELLGGDDYLASGHILAGTPEIHRQLKKMFAPYLKGAETGTE